MGGQRGETLGLCHPVVEQPLLASWTDKDLSLLLSGEPCFYYILQYWRLCCSQKQKKCIICIVRTVICTSGLCLLGSGTGKVSMNSDADAVSRVQYCSCITEVSYVELIPWLLISVQSTQRWHESPWRATRTPLTLQRRGPCILVLSSLSHDYHGQVRCQDKETAYACHRAT